MPQRLLAPVALALACGLSAHAQDAAPRDRAEATAIIADMRRVVTADGVERLERVRIGGIDQWVSIRGNDRRNPVLLMLHGGPGWVAMPTSWYFQRGWEEYFTVVQWDQRGAGKTYATNDPDMTAATLTRERMLDDAEEMVGWLRGEFGREKIFVLGHSWGSWLGLHLAQRRPEWLHAYIGMGQITDSMESERRGWQFAMDAARRAGNEDAVSELQSLAPYAQGPTLALDDLLLQRKWLNSYGGMVHGRTGGEAEARAFSLAPEYEDADIAAAWAGNTLSMHRLLDLPALDSSDVTTLECPVILLLGRHDHNVSSSVAAEWYAAVQAPSKALVWFEHSAREIMNEEPGKTLLSLVEYARPFAERAGDVPPRSTPESRTR